MTRMLRFLPAAHGLLFLAPAAGITMLIAACGGVAYGGSTGYGAASSAATASSAASVTARASSLGQILTGAQGRTLYLFEKDSGSASACDSSCAAVWPPFTTTGGALAGGGASASLVATITPGHGAPQGTYNGHPPYYYLRDRNPRDT